MPTIKEMGNTLHEIGDWIHQLEEKLAGLGMHIGTSGKRRGRPPGSVNKRQGSAAGASAAKPRKRGRRGSLGKEIVSYLQSAKGPVMPLQIRKDLNALATSVSTTLNRLAKAGQVKRHKSGRGWTA
jgi:hypothetical protein